jgi:hypothetical protein
MAKNNKSSKTPDNEPQINTKDQKLLTDFLKEQAKGNKENLSFLKEQKSLQEQLLKNENRILDAVLKRKAAGRELQDISSTLADLQKKLTAEEKKSGKIKDAALAADLEFLKNYKEKVQAEFDIQSSLAKGLVARKKSLKTEQAHLKVLEEANKVAEKYVNSFDDMLEPFDQVDKWMKNIPGGGLMSEALGLDKVKENIKKKVIDQLTNAQAAGEGVNTTLLKWGAALGAFWILTKVISWFDEIEGSAVQLAKDMDISKNQAFELEKTAHAMSNEMDVMGIHTAEVTKAMAGLRAATGINYGELAKTNEAAKDLVQTTTLLMEKQGITAEEAAALNTAAVTTGANMSEMAFFAESLSDGLVSGKEIMKDIGKVSKSVLINFNKNPEALVKAVKKAKLLGTTLDDINKAGDAMLDIESSLENEMKANVLTGKHMNLNRARELALMGDTAGLQDEIVKQMGSADEYLEMEPYKRKATAEALGMSVDQLDTMMTKQKELEAAGITASELEKSLKVNQEDRAKVLEDMRKGGREEAAKLLEAKYAEDDRLKTSEKFADGMKDLTDNLKGALLPAIQGMSAAIAPVAKFFANNATWLVPLVGGFAAIALSMKAFGVAKNAIGGIKDTVGGITGMLKGGAGKGGGLLDSITGGDKAQKQLDSVNKQADSAQSIGKKIGDFGKGIGDFIKNVAKGVGDAIEGILTGLANGVGALANPKLLLGALVLGAIGLALWAFVPIVKALTPLLIGLAKVVGEVLMEALKQAGPIIKSIFEGIANVLEKVGPIITTIFEGIGAVVEKAGNAIATVMHAIADSIIKLSSIDGSKLFNVAGGVTALGIALAAFGGGGLLAGLGSALGKLFDEDPVEKFNRFALIDAGKLQAVAAAINAMSEAMKNFTSSVENVGSVDSVIEGVEKLLELADSTQPSAVENLVDNATAAVTSIFDTASSFLGGLFGSEEAAPVAAAAPAPAAVNAATPAAAPAAGPAKEATMSDIASLLKELITKVDQPIQFNIGGKVIDEIESQTALKRSTTTKLDRSYKGVRT